MRLGTLSPSPSARPHSAALCGQLTYIYRSITDSWPGSRRIGLAGFNTLSFLTAKLLKNHHSNHLWTIHLCLGYNNAVLETRQSHTVRAIGQARHNDSPASCRLQLSMLPRPNSQVLLCLLGCAFLFKRGFSFVLLAYDIPERL